MAAASGRLIASIVNHCTIAVARHKSERLVIPSLAMSADDSLPDDVATLKAMLLARSERRAWLRRPKRKRGRC